MIKISSHSYKPLTGEGPFTYLWSSPNTCVSFDAPAGTVKSGESFTTDVFVSSLTCFQYGSDKIQLTLIDINQCQTIHDFYPSDPCGTLIVTDITQSEMLFNYSVGVSGGVPPYDYLWTVEPSGFIKNIVSAPGLNYSNLHITPIPREPIPQTINVGVTITDSNGCKISQRQQYPTGNLILNNILVTSICVKSGNFLNSKFIKFDPLPKTQLYSIGETALSVQSSIPGCNVDWSTLKFDLPSSDIQVTTNTTTGVVSMYGIKEGLFSADGILKIPFTAKDCNGVTSNQAFLIISKGTCSQGFGPNLPDTCPLIINDLCITDCDSVFTINLEDLIVSPDCCSDNSIDWTTFDILPGGPIDPATVDYNASNHTITYTSNGSTEIADLIRWSISDALGNHSGVKTIQIARLCPQAPSCTDDCYYVSQNAVDHPLHVLVNDLGPNLVPSSLVISEIPTHGTAYVLNGDIYYTPFNTYEGVDTLKYKIFNSDGLSCEATVTLTIAANGPAGTGNSIVTCADPTVLFNDVAIEGVSSIGEFDIIFTAYKNDHEPLVNGDELDVEIFMSGSGSGGVEIASATLIIGQDYTTLAGVKTGTDDQWLTGTNFAQFLTPGILTAATLVTGQTIKFNKHNWAWNTGNTNTYANPIGSGVNIINSKILPVKMKARSISDSIETLFVTKNIVEVKIFSFEDTAHAVGKQQANGAGIWEVVSGIFTFGFYGDPLDPDPCVGINCLYSLTGLPFTADCFAGDGGDDLIGYYDCTGAVNVCGTKTVVEYKIIGSSPINPILNTFKNATQFGTLLNSYGSWTGTHIACNHWLSGTNNYNIYGHNSTYYNSNYMLTTAPELEYFIIEYTGGSGINEGTQVKCTTVSHILF